MIRKMYLGNSIYPWHTPEVETPERKKMNFGVPLTPQLNYQELGKGIGFLIVYETYEDFKKDNPGQEPFMAIPVENERTDDTSIQQQVEEDEGK